jgi:lipopolysaccharide transport system permease protein
MKPTIIEPKRSLISIDIKEVYLYRELFYFFSWRDIKVKYKQTVLGFVWVILQPLIMMTIFTLFFQRTFKIETAEMPYPVFCFTGLLFWNLFSSGLSTASNSMVSNANIIKKIYFPRLIIPISSIIVSMFDFLVTLVIYFVICFYWKFTPSINVVLFLPIAIVITLFTTIGLGLLLSSLNVKYRDFRYVVPFMIQILLFVTPVIYPISMIDNLLVREFLSYNPIAVSIQITRSSLMGELVSFFYVATGLVISIATFIFGIFFFRSVENEFADIV